MDQPAPDTKRGASALLGWAFRHAHAGYLALPPALRALLRRLWPGFLRRLARERLVPLLHLPGRQAVPWRRGLDVVIDDPNGVTLVGYLYGAFGVAENLRALARACVAAAVPVEIHDVPIPERAVQVDAGLTHLVSRRRRYATQIHCLNADGYLVSVPELRQAVNPGKYRIGNWFWELPEFPAAWAEALGEVDELWAASPFIQASLTAATSKPVIYMPMAVDFELEKPYRRSDFGLPEGHFLCLFAYDFHSFVARKNPAAAIAAFQEAFPPDRQDVGLVIKTLGGARYPDALRPLEALARRDPRVMIRDVELTRDEVHGLQSVCDVFVSLHRSEGFGLSLAEAMLLGKPVVATGYSGNLAFMSAANSCLVEYRLVPVREGEYPFGAGQSWAEPDIAGAAAWLRRLEREPAYRHALGESAARTIREHHSALVVGTQIKRRLKAIADSRRRQ